MDKNNKHTEGEILIEPSRQKRNDADLLLVTESHGNAIGKVYRDDSDDEEGAANAERIVTMWNNFNPMLDALGIMTQLCRLKYGNLDPDVWEEIQKAEALINKLYKP